MLVGPLIDIDAKDASKGLGGGGGRVGGWDGAVEAGPLSLRSISNFEHSVSRSLALVLTKFVAVLRKSFVSPLRSL